ncbi:uncharacterized protein LOC122510193 [Leptopilina heterotoma]|uniref:uncharacterized protein LOC122510193 n=1 Tax=Leptopilina heterotoma TaxID=63436 RepID=UPI001CA936D3|nr:uncharacterized protein LOC122510193 [Leptopilina heterotoma]
MKEIFIFAVVIAAVGAYEPGEEPLLPVPTKCPETNGNVAVHIANEYDCTKFYKCNYGLEVPMDCPYSDLINGYLHFNKELQVCDWPWSAGCEELPQKPPNKPTITSTTTTTTTTTTKKPTTTSTTTTTKKPTTTSTTTTTKKPTTTSTTTTTEKPTTTSTTTTKKPTTTSTTTTTEKPVTPEVPEVNEKCPKGQGASSIKLPDKTNCKNYYVCHEDGTSHNEQCDEDFFFDPETRMCDFDEDGTHCPQKPTITLSSTPKPNTNHKCPEVDDPKKPTVLPHECQCHIYFVCKNGKKVEEFCPNEKRFDIKTRKCLPKSEATCGNSHEGQTTSTTENQPKPTTDLYSFLKMFRWEKIYCFAVIIAAVTTVNAYYPGDTPIIPIPKKCPKDNSGDAVHIAHEYDCTKFYKCDWGRKVLQYCPYMNENKDRLHFNRVLQVCDWPWDAGCEGHDPVTDDPVTDDPVTDDPITDDPITDDPITDDPITDDPITTTTEEVTETPTDDFYTPSTTTGTTPPLDECPIGVPGTAIPDKTDCRSYYVCHADGSSHKETCQGDDVFDPRIGMCDYDDGTICHDGTTPLPTTTTTTTEEPEPEPEPEPECPDVDDPDYPVLHPHECQCHIYYVCENGKAFKKYCPVGMGFDVHLQRCLPMSIVHCAQPDDDDDDDDDTSIVIANQPSNNEDTSKDTSFFLKLFHWDKFTIMKSLLISLVVCMVILIVHADDNPIKPIPKDCPKKDSLDYTVHIAHEKDCSRFYKCQAGKKVPKEGLLCPKMKNGLRLHFNPLLQVCDWPANVKCSLPVKPMADELPESEDLTDELLEDDDADDDLEELFLSIACLLVAGASSSLASEEIETQGVSDWQNPMWCKGSCPLTDPIDHTVLLNHWDCDKYCACNHGRPIVNICPAGLFFNSKLQTCDFPESADCHNLEFLNEIIEAEDVLVETVTPSWQNPSTCKRKCPDIDDPHKVTLLENKNCTTFCMCHMGTPYVKECPKGLIFSHSHQTCSWPYLVTCPQIN